MKDEESLNPTLTWDKLKVKHKVQSVAPIPWDTPKPEGHTRFVCISDTHNKTEGLKIPDGDVLLHGGDFSMVGLPGEIEQFVLFLRSLPHKHKVVIAGNHDLTFDAEFKNFWRNFSSFGGHKTEPDIAACRKILLEADVCTYLEDSETTVNGIRIYGSPWQPEFGGWGFNLMRGGPCREVWSKIPEGIDILITHGPPIGHGDLCRSQLRAGCVDLLREVQERVRPKYHVFGHIHEGYGMTTNGCTTFVNASTCNLQYRPIQKPIIFDLPNKE